MTSRTLAALFIALLGTSVDAQVAPAPQPSQPWWNSPSGLSAPPGLQPRGNIICGTSIFQADPAVDPKMARTVPPGQFTLRSLQPRVCRDTFAASGTALMRRLPLIFGPKR